MNEPLLELRKKPSLTSDGFRYIDSTNIKVFAV